MIQAIERQPDTESALASLLRTFDDPLCASLTNYPGLDENEDRIFTLCRELEERGLVARKRVTSNSIVWVATSPLRRKRQAVIARLMDKADLLDARFSDAHMDYWQRGYVVMLIEASVANGARTVAIVLPIPKSAYEDEHQRAGLIAHFGGDKAKRDMATILMANENIIGPSGVLP